MKAGLQDEGGGGSSGRRALQAPRASASHRTLREEGDSPQEQRVKDVRGSRCALGRVFLPLLSGVGVAIPSSSPLTFLGRLRLPVLGLVVGVGVPLPVSSAFLFLEDRLGVPLAGGA